MSNEDIGTNEVVEVEKRKNLRITNEEKLIEDDNKEVRNKPKKHKEVNYEDFLNEPDEDEIELAQEYDYWGEEDDYVQDNYWNSYEQEDSSYEDYTDRELYINKKFEELYIESYEARR